MPILECFSEGVGSPVSVSPSVSSLSFLGDLAFTFLPACVN